MAGVLLAEDLQRGLGLRERADEIGLYGLEVGRRLTRADRRPLAEPGVHDDAIEAAEFAGQRAEGDRHRVEVGDVESGDRDLCRRGSQFGGQRLEFVEASRGECQRTPLGGESAGHALAESRTRTRDEDLLPCRRGHGPEPTGTTAGYADLEVSRRARMT